MSQDANQEVHQPWRSSNEEGLRGWIQEAVGSASVCWVGGPGDRIFDENKARWVADGLFHQVSKHVDRPRLGLATTREMLEELAARMAVGVDDELLQARTQQLRKLVQNELEDDLAVLPDELLDYKAV